MAKRIELVGQKFDRLEVICLAGKNKHGNYLWECQCSCGNKHTATSGHLRTGHTKSCGCLKGVVLKARYKGKKLPEETKRKMAIAREGRTLSEEHKRNLSKAFEGEKSYNWNSNLTEEDRMSRRLIPGYKEWVQSVFKLDNHTCQKCGDNKGGNLNAHHIESYRANPTLRTEVSNGITLCETCHKDFHHQYGYGDNTRAQLIKFLGREYMVHNNW